MMFIKTQKRVAVALLSMVAVVSLAACGGSDEAVDASANEAPNASRYVRVAPVETISSVAPLPFSGTVTASSGADLAFQTSGRVARRVVEVGQRVQAGELLLVLDNPQLAPALESAVAREQELQTRYDQAQRDQRRVDGLFASGAATREEHEQVEANAQALKAALSLARAERARAQALLDETRLKAPFAGEITAVMVDEGQIVAPGQSVLALSGESHLELEIGVLARMLPVLELGQNVTLLQFGEALDVHGEISRIATASLPGALNRVVVRLPQDARLHAGMTLGVALPSTPQQALLSVPMRAVVDIGLGAPRVFQLREDTVEARAVQLVRILGERVLVSGELAAGDLVVIAGLSGLQHGQRVERVK